MTIKYLMTDYIAGQHDPHRNAVWSLALKPGCLWKTVISEPQLLPAHLYIRAVLCRISLACPKKRATAARAEESEGDRSCCIASSQCPLAPQSQQFSWRCRGACLWECITPGPPLSPRVHTRVLAWVGTLPFQGDTEPHWPPTPLPVMSHVQREDLLYRNHVLS